MMRQFAKKIALRLPELSRIIRQRDEALARVAELEIDRRISAMPFPEGQTRDPYIMLPGTQYSRYAMPLDYPPRTASSLGRNTPDYRAARQVDGCVRQRLPHCA